MDNAILTRPEPGTKTEWEMRIPVCARCGFIIQTGLCSGECDLDGYSHKGETIIAVYQRTDVFMRDEKADE